MIQCYKFHNLLRFKSDSLLLLVVTPANFDHGESSCCNHDRFHTSKQIIGYQVTADSYLWSEPKCLLRCCLYMNLFSHLVHLYGSCWLWTLLMCSFRYFSILVLNLLQWGHFSSVFLCVSRWKFKSWFLKNQWPQLAFIHLNVGVFRCMILCLSSSLWKVKCWSHMSQGKVFS